MLRQLNDNCEFLGSLSSTSATRFLIEDCQRRGINIEHCVYHDNCVTPFSSVILNMKTGSRTIVHSNPNLPILTAVDFRKIPLQRYKWIHFEVGAAIEMNWVLSDVSFTDALNFRFFGNRLEMKVKPNR